MIDAMKGAELPEAVLGPPSRSAEALPRADEESHPANIRRSFEPEIPLCLRMTYFLQSTWQKRDHQSRTELLEGWRKFLREKTAYCYLHVVPNYGSPMLLQEAK